jgi:hypothetical protein
MLYRKDHGKSNNYLGRCLSDLGFFFVFAILITVYHSLTADSLSPLFRDSESLIGMTLAFSLLFMAIEGIISLFKYLFRFLKWQIV